MIFYAISQLILTVLNGVLSLIPAYSLPGSMTQSFASAGAAAAGLNTVFPIGTLGACLVVVVALRVLIAFVGFLGWVWDKIPFKFS